MRLGVIICDCGGEIARRLDTEALRQEAASLSGVVYTAREAYPCSKDGRARLQQAISAWQLERVLIAGCTPRTVERLFREVGQAAGLEAGCVEVANIREQCAYVHAAERVAAAQKAAGLIEMGVARLSATRSPQMHTGRVVKSALVIGSGLTGLTAALALADDGISVTLLESPGAHPGLDDRARELLAERVEAATVHPHICTLANARLAEVRGRPGDYEAQIAHGGNGSSLLSVGAIVVASGARTRSPQRWYDRNRVVSQAEFEIELTTAEQAGTPLAPRDIVMVPCVEEAGGGRCSRVCCMAGIRQALRAKQLNPQANVTVLFRDLYLGGSSDLHADELDAAREAGAAFFRYSKAHPPIISEKTVDVPDQLTGEALRLPCDRAVLALPLEPADEAATLAALLRIPQDRDGFMVEPRVRLRPGHFVDDGIFVLGGAHQPADTTETLFQAYVTSARASRFLNQEMIRVDAPVAEVDAALCTGCAECAPVCPTTALTLKKREAVVSLAAVEALRCTGCGNCVVACPVKAIALPGWEDGALLAQISAALRQRNGEPPDPRVIAFACEWSAYAAADLAGARLRAEGNGRSAYPANVRLVRLPCSARFDLYFALWAFLNGADKVFVGACPPGECHYGVGNRFARERVEALRKQLAEHGIDSSRLRLEFLPGDDGEKFARAVTEFVKGS